MPGNVPNPTPIIHMTHLDNLGAILAAGGLRATAQLLASGAAFTNIAYGSIQAQRAAKQVPCGPGGCLHDYVPFYFTKRSPMLYTISRGNVPCEGGQDAIVHMVSTAQRVAAGGCHFAFSDGHGIMAYSHFFDDLAHLCEVDWDVIRSTYWSDTPENPDRKRRKQAEFLVHGSLPLARLNGIVVRTPAARDQVVALLSQTTFSTEVVVRPQWYY